MEILFEQQTKLIPTSGEVDNTQRCRLEALIQSYDLYNSEQFSAIKPIKDLLETSGNMYRLCHEGQDIDWSTYIEKQYVATPDKTAAADNVEMMNVDKVEEKPTQKKEDEEWAV